MTLLNSVKKLTLPVVVFAVVGGLMVATGQANAIFNIGKNRLKVSGTVVEIHSDSFVMDTDSSDPAFEIIIDNKTSFKDPLNDLSDLLVGDEVEVKAKIQNNGTRIATKVELVNDESYGYGSGCGRFRIARARVLSVNSSELVVKRNGIDVTISIDDDTVIRGYKHNRTVKVGDFIDVRGEDCGGGSLLAEKIIIRNPKSNHNEDNGNRGHGNSR